MILPGDTVAAAVSGGSDSVVMLHILIRYLSDKKMAPAVIHVNHGIRGDEARRDADFVRDLASGWKTDYALYEYDVPALAKRWGMSLEEAGRTARKDAFARFLSEKGNSPENYRIALAHNRNDLGETVIHNLARGTGLRGLCSMKPVSGQLIRPVLCLSKDEIYAYIEENGLSYITDSTNLTEDYTRNRIRRNVIPYLEDHVNRQALSHIAETSALCDEAVSYLERKACETLEKCAAGQEKKEKKSLLLGAPFLSEDPELQPYVVLEALERLAGQRKDFTYRHVRDVMDLVSGNTGRSISLPCGLRAVREYGGIRLTCCGEDIDIISSKRIKTNLFSYKGQKIQQKLYTKWFDYDKIKDDVVFRTRREGDYMVIHPDGRRKKLTRIMMDDRIPASERDRILLAAAGSHILWIPGGRSSEGFRVGPETKTVLELKVTEESEE